MGIIQPPGGGGGRQFNISDYLSPAEIAEIQSERSFRGAKGFVDAFVFSGKNPDCKRRLNDNTGSKQLPEYDDGTRSITITRQGEDSFQMHASIILSSTRQKEQWEPEYAFGHGLASISVLGSPATFDFPLDGPAAHLKACQVVGKEFKEATSDSLSSGRLGGLSMMRSYLLQFQAYLDGASGFYQGLGMGEVGGVIAGMREIRDGLRKPMQDTVIAVHSHPDKLPEPKKIGEMPADGKTSWGSRFAWEIIQKLAGNYMPNYQPGVDTSTCLYRHGEMFSSRMEKQTDDTEGTITFSIPIRQRPIPERAQRIFFHLGWDSQEPTLPELAVFAGFEGVRPLREEGLKIEKRHVPLTNVGAEAVKSAKDLLANLYNL